VPAEDAMAARKEGGARGDLNETLLSQRESAPGRKYLTSRLALLEREPTDCRAWLDYVEHWGEARAQTV